MMRYWDEDQAAPIHRPHVRPLTRRERVGHRLLDMLDRYSLKTTFFIPGLVIDQRPALMEEILKRGHEIAHHSYSHTWILNLTPAQELGMATIHHTSAEKTIPELERLLGVTLDGLERPSA